jgi:hypothetical protein
MHLKLYAQHSSVNTTKLVAVACDAVANGSLLHYNREFEPYFV